MLKIYGERNTGTNYVSALIEKNLRVALLPGVAHPSCQTEAAKDAFFTATYAANLGWKHGVAPEPEFVAKPEYSGVKFVTVTKNPYAWLVSFFRRPYHHPGASRAFPAFIRSPVPDVGRERLPAACENPILLWNAKCRSYLRLPEDRHLSLRYETLLENPRGMIERIADRFEILKTPAFFSNIIRSTKGTAENYSDYQNFYLGEAWKAAFSDEDIAFVRQHLDPELMFGLGYAVL